MEPALDDLMRELTEGAPHSPELDVELEVVDDVLLDPWFVKTEQEIAAIEDDPTAKVIEIQITDYSDRLTEPHWS